MRILYARSLVPLMSSIGSAWKCDVDSKLVVRNMKPSFFSNNLLLGLTLLLFVGSLSSFFSNKLLLSFTLLLFVGSLFRLCPSCFELCV